MSWVLGIALLVFLFIGVPLLLPWIVVKLTSREAKKVPPLMETALPHHDSTPISKSVAYPPTSAEQSVNASLGSRVAGSDDSIVSLEDPNLGSGYAIILYAFLRLLGGLAGVTILMLLCHVIFTEREIPAGRGYYGPVMFPACLYIAYVFIGYAFGGEGWLRELRTSFQFLRIVASFGIVFIILWLCLVLAGRGFPQFALVWLYPGKVIAPLAASWVPEAWVLGNPSSPTYSPDTSAEGFAFMCTYIFWAVAVFLVWEGVRIFRLRSKGKTHA